LEFTAKPYVRVHTGHLRESWSATSGRQPTDQDENSGKTAMHVAVTLLTFCRVAGCLQQHITQCGIVRLDCRSKVS